MRARLIGASIERVSESTIHPDETAVPLMPCASLEETAAMRRALGKVPVELEYGGAEELAGLGELRALELSADGTWFVEEELGHLPGLQEWLG